MKKISAWTGRRSGGRITITGREQSEGEAVGHDVKVSNVDTIHVETDGQIIATDKDGVGYLLLTEAPF